MPRGPTFAALLPALLLAGACAPSARAETVAAPRPSAAPLALAPDTGTVVVTGTARVSVQTDRARVRFAVETEAATAAEAVTQNASRMDRALAALRPALGDGGTLETSGYSLAPIYRQPPRDTGGEPRIAAYRALNHVEATVTDVARVGRLLDAAVEAGVNRVVGITFYAEDTREARLEALRRATERAREEAGVLAAALGVPLGAPLQVHSSSDMPPPMQQMYMRTMEMDQAAVSTPVEPGEQEVVATVSITYRIGEG
jgi:hypothetical protein